MFLYKIRWLLIIFFCVTLGILYIYSTSSVRLQLAAACLNRHDEAGAAAIYREIIRKETIGARYRTLKPRQFADTHFILAGLLLKQHRMNEAMDALMGLAKTDPSYDRSFPAGVLKTPQDNKIAAFCFARAGLLAMAVARFQDYLAQADDDYRGHYQLGLLYRKIGDNRNAAEQLKKAAHISGGAVFFHSSALDCVIEHKFSDTLTLAGYSLDEAEFELFNAGKVAWFWDRAGRRETTVTEAKNLAPDFGFEMNFVRTGYPYGWNDDRFGAPEGCYRIAIDRRNGADTRCFVVTDPVGDVGPQSTIYSADPGYYLQSGWMKSVNSAVSLASIWFDSKRIAVQSNGPGKLMNTGQWRGYHAIFEVKPSLKYCRLVGVSRQSPYPTWYDNMLLVKVELPQ